MYVYVCMYDYIIYIMIVMIESIELMKKLNPEFLWLVEIFTFSSQGLGWLNLVEPFGAVECICNFRNSQAGAHLAHADRPKSRHQVQLLYRSCQKKKKGVVAASSMMA